MRTLVGVQKISSGQVRVLGLIPGSPQLRARIGYVSQSPAIYEDISAEENLRYFASLVKAPKQQVDELLQSMNLQAYRSQLVRTLSGGQRARTSLAIALLGSPDVLVLDEPTVGQDPLLREELWHMFRLLADAGKTLIISSHVMNEAERCDSLALIREGSVLWQGTVNELQTRTHTQSVEKAFIQLVQEGKA